MSRDEHPGYARRTCQLGRIVQKLGVFVVVALLAAGVAVHAGLVPGRLGGPGPRTRPPPVSVPSVVVLAPAAPEPVLRPAIGATATVSVPRLRRHVGRLLHSPSLGQHLGFEVAPLRSLRPLLRVGSPARVTPASTMKLLTTTTALRLLGDQHRFTTSVVTGSRPGSIVLVGGGDPLLADTTPVHRGYPRQASLQQLAQRTARRLHQRGVRRVRLSYDATLFRGPAVNPAWEKTYVPESVVSPISALWVDEGQVSRGEVQRSRDPALTAARRFAVLMRKAGVRVQGSPTVATAPAHATSVARVRSAPLSRIVEHILERSDNEGAEVLLRQVAVAAGRPGSSLEGVKVVRATLGGLGVDVGGLRQYDGSGLSRHDRVPLDTLVQVLQADAKPGLATLRTVLTSLPVAGFTGTATHRFVHDASVGAGVVRAKTGTLTGVSALAGVVMTRRGQPLVFVAVADRVPVVKKLAARDQLDRIVAALATCGC